MESMDRDLEQALTGLGLCPSPSRLTPSRHNDLLEVPREFSGSSGVPGSERRYSYGGSGQPQGSDSEFSQDPRMRGDQQNSDAYRSRGHGSGSRGGGASAAPARSVYYAPGDFDSSDSEPWFRPPSRDSYLGLDSLRRSGGKSRVRSGGQGDQVASHSTRRGRVVVVESSDDSASQSAYFSAQGSRSGSPVEYRGRSVHQGAQGSGISSSEGEGWSSSHRSRGGRVDSSGGGSRHSARYSDPGVGSRHSARHSDPGPGGYRTHRMQEPDRDRRRASQGTPQGHRFSPSQGTPQGDRFSPSRDPHPRATPEGGPSHISGRARTYPVDPIPEDSYPADYPDHPWEGEGFVRDHHRSTPSVGRHSSLARPQGIPRSGGTHAHS